MKRTIVPQGMLALSLAIVLLAAPARGNALEPASVTGQSSSAAYVALGDSVAAPAGSYVDRLFPLPIDARGDRDRDVGQRRVREADLGPRCRLRTSTRW